MDDKIQTSQQKAGEHSDPGGKDDANKPGFASGTSDSPSGVECCRSGDAAFQTSQQLRAEHKKIDTNY